MKSQDFQILLFKTAIMAMSCDGNISDSEVSEIKSLADNEIYFINYNYEKPLEETIDCIKYNGKKAINDYLEELKNADLNERQELLLIEVVIRIIEADKKLAENEIKFLQIVKTKLKISQESLIVNFPNQIEYLVDSNNFSSFMHFDDEIKLK